MYATNNTNFAVTAAAMFNNIGKKTTASKRRNIITSDDDDDDDYDNNNNNNNNNNKYIYEPAKKRVHINNNSDDEDDWLDARGPNISHEEKLKNIAQAKLERKKFVNANQIQSKKILKKKKKMNEDDDDDSDLSDDISDDNMEIKDNDQSTLKFSMMKGRSSDNAYLIDTPEDKSKKLADITRNRKKQNLDCRDNRLKNRAVNNSNGDCNDWIKSIPIEKNKKVKQKNLKINDSYDSGSSNISCIVNSDSDEESIKSDEEVEDDSDDDSSSESNSENEEEQDEFNEEQGILY
jgi:hypothetical protein